MEQMIVRILLGVAAAGIVLMTVWLLILVSHAHALAAGKFFPTASRIKIKKHKRNVFVFDVLVLVSVIAIELLVRVSGGLWVTGTFFWTHMCFVTCFSGLLILLHVKNGLRSRYHAVLAYSFLFMAILTVGSGTWLLLQHPLL